MQTETIDLKKMRSLLYAVRCNLSFLIHFPFIRSPRCLASKAICNISALPDIRLWFFPRTKIIICCSFPTEQNTVQYAPYQEAKCGEMYLANLRAYLRLVSQWTLMVPCETELGKQQSTVLKPIFNSEPSGHANRNY